MILADETTYPSTVATLLETTSAITTETTPNTTTDLPIDTSAVLYTGTADYTTTDPSTKSSPAPTSTTKPAIAELTPSTENPSSHPLLERGVLAKKYLENTTCDEAQRGLTVDSINGNIDLLIYNLRNDPVTISADGYNETCFPIIQTYQQTIIEIVFQSNLQLNWLGRIFDSRGRGMFYCHGWVADMIVSSQ